MNSGYGLASPGPLTAAPPADDGRTTLHINGLSDALGDRVVVLDARGTPTLELLRFALSLTATAGFEVALRRQAQQLRHFRHLGFVPTPAVEYAGDDRRLALVSTYVPATRLSDVVADARGPVFAGGVIQQLTPALAALHRYSGGVGHGALTASRIAITEDGRLLVLEHVLGSALDRLQLTPQQMLRDLGIPAPPAPSAAHVRIDPGSDYFQLGLIALSLLHGRPLSTDECLQNLDRTLSRSVESWDEPAVERFGWLTAWLERALQINGRRFSSSAEAQAGVPDVADHDMDDLSRRWRVLLPMREARTVTRLDPPQHQDPEPAAAPDSSAPEDATLPPAEAAAWPGSVAPAPDVPRDDPPAVADVVNSEPSLPMEVAPVADTPPVRLRASDRGHALWLTSSPWTRPATIPMWAAAALASCVVVEALIVGMLVRGRWNAPPPAAAAVNLETADPGALVVVDGRPLGVTPLQVQIGPDVRSITLAGPRPQGSPPESMVGSTGQQHASPQGAREQTAAPAAPARDAGAPQPSGGINVSSPIAVEVFEGDARLGTSVTGIVSARPGRRELDLVNSALGFRTRQTVDVRSGQVVSLTVSPPPGRININAFPWAEVLIDGRSVGETPIGNLTIPLGEHEIVFRHPQLGERRQTAVVRADAVTRVSANLER